MKLTIGIKIFLGYAVAFLAIVALSITSYLTVRHLEENFHEAQAQLAPFEGSGQQGDAPGLYAQQAGG